MHNGLLVTLGFAFVLYKWTARLLEIESIIIFLGKSGSESARLTNEPSKPLQTKKQCDKNFTSHNVSFFTLPETMQWGNNVSSFTGPLSLTKYLQILEKLNVHRKCCAASSCNERNLHQPSLFLNLMGLL